MRFGILLSLQNPDPWKQPWVTLYERGLEQAQYAEQLGFDHVWLTEHHFTTQGFLPSVLTMAAAIAARTQRIRVGSYVLLLPLHHPVDIAEQASVVDVLSGGRLSLGIGSGYRPSEFAGYSVAKADRGRLMEEGLRILQKCFREENFDYDGNFYRLRRVDLSPRPIQKPNPPILLGNPASSTVLQRAARLGVEGLAGRPSQDGWAQFLEERSAHGHSGPVDVANLRFVFVGESDEEARRYTADQWQYYSNCRREWRAEAGLPTTEPEASPYAQKQLIIGSPERCVRQIVEMIGSSSVPLDDLIVQMQFGGVDDTAVMRSMQLFAKEVVPAVKSYLD